MDQIGLTEDHLSANCIPRLKTPLLNGLVYELFCYAKTTSPSPIEAVLKYISQLLGIYQNSIPFPALKSKISRLCNNYRSKGGKGRMVFLKNEFVVPTCTVTTMTKVERNVLSEMSEALRSSESTVENQHTTITK
jgi:hypothetical protein